MPLTVCFTMWIPVVILQVSYFANFIGNVDSSNQDIQGNAEETNGEDRSTKKIRETSYPGWEISQAFNFARASTSVDPRTGNLNLRMSLGAFALYTKVVPIELVYSSFLARVQDSNPYGIGIGWAFNFPYCRVSENAKSDYIVNDGLGHSFQISRQQITQPPTHEADIRYYRTKDTMVGLSNVSNLEFVLKRGGDAYTVSHPVYARGFKYESSEGFRYEFVAKSKISHSVYYIMDTDTRSLLAYMSPITLNGEIRIQIFDWLDIGSAVAEGNNVMTYTLTVAQGLLKEVVCSTCPDMPSYKFSYEQGSDTAGVYGAIKSIIHPSGLTEKITYGFTGPLTTTYVVEKVQKKIGYNTNARRSRKRRSVTVKYNYDADGTGNNFVGQPKFYLNSPNLDPLFEYNDTYVYATTVFDGRISTKYAYNKFHLLTSVETTDRKLSAKDANKQLARKIELFYPCPDYQSWNQLEAECNDVASFSLPSAKIVTDYDQNAHKPFGSFVTKEIYKYDDWGNNILQILASGVQKHTVYGGDEGRGGIRYALNERWVPSERRNYVDGSEYGVFGHNLTWTKVKSIAAASETEKHFYVLSSDEWYATAEGESPSQVNITNITYYQDSTDMSSFGRIKSIVKAASENATRTVSEFYEYQYERIDSTNIYSVLVIRMKAVASDTRDVMKTVSKTHLASGKILEILHPNETVSICGYDNMGRTLFEATFPDNKTDWSDFHPDIPHTTPYVLIKTFSYRMKPGENEVVSTEYQGKKERLLLDDSGLVTEIQLVMEDKNATFATQAIKYDEQDRITSLRFYWNDNVNIKKQGKSGEKYSYDAVGRLTETCMIESKGCKKKEYYMLGEEGIAKVEWETIRISCNRKKTCSFHASTAGSYTVEDTRGIVRKARCSRSFRDNGCFLGPDPRDSPTNSITVHLYEYDHFDRLSKVCVSTGKYYNTIKACKSYTYSITGQLKTSVFEGFTPRSGKEKTVLEYFHDPLHNIVRKIVSLNSGVVIEERNYDGFGRILEEVSGGYKSKLEYSHFDKVTKVTHEDCAVEYEYDSYRRERKILMASSKTGDCWSKQYTYYNNKSLVHKSLLWEGSCGSANVQTVESTSVYLAPRYAAKTLHYDHTYSKPHFIEFDYYAGGNLAVNEYSGILDKRQSQITSNLKAVTKGKLNEQERIISKSQHSLKGIGYKERKASTIFKYRRNGGVLQSIKINEGKYRVTFFYDNLKRITKVFHEDASRTMYKKRFRMKLFIKYNQHSEVSRRHYKSPRHKNMKIDYTYNDFGFLEKRFTRAKSKGLVKETFTYDNHFRLHMYDCVSIDIRKYCPGHRDLAGFLQSAKSLGAVEHVELTYDELDNINYTDTRIVLYEAKRKGVRKVQVKSYYSYNGSTILAKKNVYCFKKCNNNGTTGRGAYEFTENFVFRHDRRGNVVEIKSEATNYVVKMSFTPSNKLQTVSFMRGKVTRRTFRFLFSGSEIVGRVDRVENREKETIYLYGTDGMLSGTLSKELFEYYFSEDEKVHGVYRKRNKGPPNVEFFQFSESNTVFANNSAFFLYSPFGASSQDPSSEDWFDLFVRFHV